MDPEGDASNRKLPQPNKSNPNLVQVSCSKSGEIDVPSVSPSRLSQPHEDNKSKYSNLIINLSVNSPVINQISGYQPPPALDSSSLNSSRWLRSRLASINHTSNENSSDSFTMQESSEAHNSASKSVQSFRPLSYKTHSVHRRK